MANRHLTPAQLRYLSAIASRRRLVQGWGGYASTRVVWRLEELGLVHLRRGDRWVASLTEQGEQFLKEGANRG